jgi:hypothetical protein
MRKTNGRHKHENLFLIKLTYFWKHKIHKIIEGNSHSTQYDSNSSHLKKGRACLSGGLSTQYKPNHQNVVSSQVFVNLGEKWKQWH